MRTLLVVCAVVLVPSLVMAGPRASTSVKANSAPAHRRPSKNTQVVHFGSNLPKNINLKPGQSAVLKFTEASLNNVTSPMWKRNGEGTHTVDLFVKTVGGPQDGKISKVAIAAPTQKGKLRFPTSLLVNAVKVKVPKGATGIEYWAKGSGYNQILEKREDRYYSDYGKNFKVTQQP